MTTIVYTGTREPDPIDGLELVHLPMLARLALPVPPEIADELSNEAHPTRHAIFYSRNAAEIALDALGNDAFQSAQLWAVGAQTADWLSETLGRSVRHPEKEEFAGLLPDLKAALAETDLVVSFELEGSDRPLEQFALGCRVISVPTYETVPTNWDDLDGLLRRLAPRWVVFASPRAFKVFRENLHHRVVGDSYRVAAIGPTTRSAIEEAGDRVDFVPDRPDLSALFREISDR